MELAIQPPALRAAAEALTRCSDVLGEAGSMFAAHAHACLPDLGDRSAASTRAGIHRAEHAVATVTSDISQLARALTALAEHYPRVDATAVPRP